MSKHDRAEQEKVLRNLEYARRFKQLKCRCGHRTSVEGRCVMCGERLIRNGTLRRRVKQETRQKEPSAWTRSPALKIELPTTTSE